MFKHVRMSTVLITLIQGSVNTSTLAGEWWQTSEGCQLWNESPHTGVVASWTGGCRAGKLSGFGILTWSHYENGSFVSSNYRGEYKDGKKDGKGTLYLSNGGRYVGKSQNDLAAGGTFYHPNGEKTWAYQGSDGKWMNKQRPDYGVTTDIPTLGRIPSHSIGR